MKTEAILLVCCIITKNVVCSASGNKTWTAEQEKEPFSHCNSSSQENGCSSPPDSNNPLSPSVSLTSKPSAAAGNSTVLPSSKPVSTLRTDPIIPAFIAALDEPDNETLTNTTITFLPVHGASANPGTPVHNIATHMSSIMASNVHAHLSNISLPAESGMIAEEKSAYAKNYQTSAATTSTTLQSSGYTTPAGAATQGLELETHNSTLVDKVLGVLSNQTQEESGLEIPVETFMLNYECFTDFSIILYRERFDNLTEASKICLIRSLCSLEMEDKDFTVGNLNVYWVKNMSESCYMEIFRDIEEEVSLSGRLTDDIGFVLLNPFCQQSRELAYGEFIGSKMSILPGMCRKLLCNAGVSEVHSESLIATLIHPHITSNYDLVDSCQHELQIEMRDGDVSSSPGHTNIFLTSRFPRGLPCTTYSVFTVVNTNSHLIMPFRSTWCRLMNRPLWESFLVDSYMGFMSESQSKLYECIAEKKRKKTSKILDYGKLIRDLIGTTISIPDIPHPCMTVICDADVEIVNILQGNGGILQWFTQINYENKRHLHLNAKMMRCQRALSNDTQIEVYDNEAVISIPQSNSLENKPLILTMGFSCPGNGGTSEEESNILKSEILATLSLLQKDLPVICMSVICNATVEKLSNKLISIMVSHNDNITQKCLNLATHSTAYAPKEYIFSFDEPLTGSSIVFLVTELHRSESTAYTLALLHMGRNARLAICCSNVHKDMSKHSFSIDQLDYSVCPVHQNDCFASSCLPNQSIWQMKYIGDGQYLLVIDNTFASSKLVNWLATLSINFSAANLEYISALEVEPLEFLNNIVFVVANQGIKNPKFLEFIYQMQNPKVRCTRSHYFTVCNKPRNRFQALTHQEGYLLFLHDCSITSLEKDKIVLLLVKRFYGVGPSDEYLCQEDVTAAMVPSVLKRVQYYSDGPMNQAAAAIQDLKAVTPSLPWVVKYNMKNSNDSLMCKMISDFNNISYYLETETCLAFHYEASVVFFGAQDLDSFNFQTFPARKLTSDIYAWGFTKVTKPFSIFPVKYVIEFSNISIHVNILGKNPVQRFIQNSHGIRPLSHKTSSVHMSKLVMHATITNNTKCLQDLQNQNFFLYSSDSTFWLGPVSGKPLKQACLSSLSDDTIDLLCKDIKQNMSTINRFWPTCSYGMVISWNKKTFQVDDWDYLLPLCKVKEVFLITMTAIPVLIILIGNAYAMTVIIRSNIHQHCTSFIVYLSHTSADFLLGLFPYSLIIHDSVSLILGSLTFKELNPDFWNANFDYLSSKKSLDMSYLTFERQGFPSFCSVLLSILFGASTLTLLLQGIQCFCLVFQKPLHRQYIKGGIYASWTTASVIAILLNWREYGWDFTGVFDPVTKITFNMSMDELSTSSIPYFLMISLIPICWIIIIVIARFLSIHGNTTQGERDFFDQEKSHTTVKAFYWMTGISSASMSLACLDIMTDMTNISPVIHFLFWWGFLVLTSLRWAVIAFTSERLMQRARGLLCNKRKLSVEIDKRLLEHTDSQVTLVQSPFEMNPLDSL